MDAPQFVPYKLSIQRLASPEDVREQLNGSRCAELPAGLNFLVSGEDHIPFSPFLEFVADRSLTKSPLKARLTKSPLTIEAYASDLCDFFWFLDAAHVRWQDVGAATAELYVDTMIERPSPVTGEPYSDATIIRRISTLRTFYGWTRKRGLSRYGLIDLDAWKSIKSRRTAEAEDTESPQAPPADREVRPIPVEDLEAIFAKLGPLPPLASLPDMAKPDSLDAVRVRNRLLAECALQVGLRRAEVTSLKTTDFVHITIDAAMPFVHHAVRVFGKGAKWRTVLFPGWLVEALQYYISELRASVPDGVKPHERLFVQHRETSARGRRLAAKYVDEVFSAACVEAGFVEPNKAHRARYVVHHLRHSYALATYFARKHAGDPEPWLEIQALLGHQFLETTLRIYLRVAKALQSKYADYFHKVFNEILVVHA